MKSLVAMMCLFTGVLLLASCGQSNKPLEFAIRYKDASGLKTGQFVVYKGLRIGEVTNVSLEKDTVMVAVKIPVEHKEKVYREAEFAIEKPGGFTDMSGEKQVTMSDRGNTRTPLTQGDVIEGYNGFLDNWMGKTIDAGKAAFEWAKGASQRAIESIKEYSASPEGQKLLAKVEEFANQGKDMASEKFEVFKKEQLPLLMDDAAKLKERLEKEGQSEKGQKLWKDVNDYVNELSKGKP